MNQWWYISRPFSLITSAAIFSPQPCDSPKLGWKCLCSHKSLWPHLPPYGGVFCLHDINVESQAWKGLLCNPLYKIQSIWSFSLHNHKLTAAFFLVNQVELPEKDGSHALQSGLVAEELVCWAKITACYEVSNLFPPQLIRSLLSSLYCMPNTVSDIFLHILGFPLILCVSPFISTKLQGCLPTPSCIIGASEVRSPQLH